jgi:hypothetical protein
MWVGPVQAESSRLKPAVRSRIVAMRIFALLVAAFSAAAQDSKPAAPQPYVVVAVSLRDASADTAAFANVAREAAKLHHAKLIEFDGKSFDDLEKELRAAAPVDVLFVIRPDAFDLNFHRRVLMMAARIDDDPFCDFSFGYMTAKDGASVAKLWARTVALHEKGLPNKTWHELGVASKFDPSAIKDFIPEIAKAAGFEGSAYFCAEKEWKNYSWEKALEHLQRMKEASVISISGNGDPQGIWLFSGNRNLDPKFHWEFDPAKVGQDPKGEMPRLQAAEWRKVALKGPVLWSGTCHSGATRRVFVEGDIVSTFGKSETVVVYELKPQDSLCLALIDAGAAALILPIGANHGMSCNLEQDFVLAWGATLGEAVRSTYADVMLQSGGKPKVELKAPGKPMHVAGAAVMQEGGMNRALFGDPALRPFKPTKHPLETTTVTPVTPRGVDVVVAWKKGFHAWSWDMYGTNRSADGRMSARVPLDGRMPASGPLPKVAATVEGKNARGEAIPFTMTHAVVERDHGRLWLHLQANTKRNLLEGDVTATFKARWE